MKNHFKFIKEFTTMLDSGTGDHLSKSEDKMMILRVMMKLCDVAHVLKPKADTVEWTRRVNEVRKRV